MNKLKIGVIGICGIASDLHIPALISNKDVEIAALCDIQQEKATAVSQQYGIARVFADYHELLDLEELDAVDICTPNFLHSSIAVDALNKGKHVFCEKPDAVSVEEVLKMKKASEESGRLLMVMRNNRFTSHARFTKKFIEEGHMGKIYAAKCGWVRRRDVPGIGSWFTNKKLSGGGPLIDLGVHMIDLALWFMGNPKPVSVVGSTYCELANRGTMADSASSSFGEVNGNGIFDVEDLAMGFVRFDNGACLALEFSWASNIDEEDYYVELMGTKAGSKWHSLHEKLQIFGEFAGFTTNLLPNVPSHLDDEMHKKNLDHFVDCILKGAQPVFTPQQGIDVIKILEAVYLSSTIGKEIIMV